MFACWRARVASAVVCAGTCLASAAPLLSIESGSLDLGLHAPESVFEHRLVLKNSGDEPLQISDLQADCACVQPRLDRPRIQPGTAADLILSFRPKAMGRDRKRISFRSNDPAHPLVSLSVEYEIAGPLRAVPSALYLGTIAPGGIRKERLALWATKDPVAILYAECADPSLKTVVRQPRAATTQPAEIQIEYRAPGRPELLNTRVTLHTSDQQNTTVQIPVRGLVSAAIQPDRTSIDLGRVPLTESGTGKLDVRVKPGTELKAVECSDPSIHVQRSGPTGDTWRITLDASSKTELGPFAADLALHPGGEEQRSLVLPVRGEIVWSDRKTATAPASLSESRPAETADTVQIDFPEEVEVQAFIDYVSASLSVNILYDEAIRGKKLTVRSPDRVQRSSLLDLLRAVLQVKGLALVEADHPGWLKVVPAANLPSQVRLLREGETPEAPRPSRVVTQVLHVTAANSSKITTAAKPFLSAPGGSMVTVEQPGSQSLLILTDYESAVSTVQRLVKLMDIPAPAAEVRFIRAQYRECTELVTEVQRILTDKARATGDKDIPSLAAASSGVITAIGLPDALAEAQKLIAELDQAPSQSQQVTRRYAPKYVDSARLRTLAEQLIVSAKRNQKDAPRFIPDADTNSFYLLAPEAVHEQVAGLLRELDSAPPDAHRPVRFYRPINRPAEPIFDTLTELLGDAKNAPVQAPEGDSSRAFQKGLSTGELFVPGPNRPPANHRNGPGAIQQLPETPALVTGTRPAVETPRGSRHSAGADYTLTMDEETNTIIAVGSAEVHRQIEEFMGELDRRRPQVLIEVTIMSLEITDGLTLGVELESYELNGKKSDYIVFNAFGLSTVNPSTGALTLAPGVGFNGAILSPDELNVVVHAVATHGRSHVIATPKILVDDNSSGTISSVSESPFTSVNASTTVATTSFAGFAEAGTTLSVQPHITNGDHLQIQYNLTFSSFTGSASNGGTVPPPRSSNSLSSVINVPDGYTAVVGGLQIDRDGDTISEVPLLGRIPILGLLFQSSDRTRSQSRVYAFIRPVILRDDQFRDLKFATTAELKKAELKSHDFPETQFQWMH